MNRPLRICFVALWTYPLFNPNATGNFGGSEVRAWKFGHNLAAYDDIRVSFSVADQGQQPLETWNDVDLHAHHFYKAFHLGEVRRFSPLSMKMAVAAVWNRIMEQACRFLPSTVWADGVPIRHNKISAYDAIGANLYCVYGVHELAAEVVAYCAARNIPSVVFAGSDAHFTRKNQRGSTARDMYGSRHGLCHYALTHADHVLAQTDRQAALARKRFGREAAVVRNPIDLGNRQPEARTDERDIALWVGKADRVKRPELALELARRHPDVPFVLVMNRSHADVFDRVMRDKTDNVTVHERLPFDETEALFARARFLVNTSVFEGFPNTFLQAGKYGVPVLSLAVDPDGFLATHGCGRFAGDDMDVLSQSLTDLASDPEAWQTCSQAIRDRVTREHDLGANVQRLHDLLCGYATT